jgi:hypothetical protein
MQDSKGFFALVCLRFYVVKCLFFLWESIGQYQQRPGSGTGFGTFGGGGERKGDMGIIAWRGFVVIPPSEDGALIGAGEPDPTEPA